MIFFHILSKESDITLISTNRADLYAVNIVRYEKIMKKENKNKLFWKQMMTTNDNVKKVTWNEN